MLIDRRTGFLCTLAAACFLILSTGKQYIWADTWTPDHDGNGFNNSFERAVDLGELRPAGISVREQLGRVPWGFDTVDVYRFVFPAGVNDFLLSVDLDEEPDTSMWIEVYDRDRKLALPPSIGNANEQIRLPLSAGLYYLKVLTNPGIANGRNLRYTLTVKPVEVPLPEQGGTACAGAPNVGNLGVAREVSGNLNEVRRSSVYALHVPFGAALNGSMFGLQPSRRYVVSVIDRLTGNSIRFRDTELQTQGIMIDPGFYCLRIESAGFAGLGNYRGRFNALRAGIMPGNDKQRAQNIIAMELGNLTPNGSYSLVSRYLHFQQPGVQPNIPSVVSHNYDYVIRDWVGVDARTQFYWFNLPPGQSKIDVRLINQMAFTRVSIEDENGNALATSQVDSSSLNPEIMPSQSLSTILPSGRRYYLRIDYLSNSTPGTSFGVILNAKPL